MLRQGCWERGSILGVRCTLVTNMLVRDVDLAFQCPGQTQARSRGGGGRGTLNIETRLQSSIFPFSKLKGCLSSKFHVPSSNFEHLTSKCGFNVHCSSPLPPPLPVFFVFIPFFCSRSKTSNPYFKVRFLKFEDRRTSNPGFNLRISNFKEGILNFGFNVLF